MSITLTPQQRDWIAAHVARGEFASVEDAIRQLVNERIAEREIEENEAGLAWAKPLVDEGLAALERGDVITLDELEARNAARLAALTR